jgi:small-conductance mechanosensitive channel
MLPHVTAPPLLVPLIVTAGLIAITLALRAVLLRVLAARIERGQNHALRALAPALRAPSVLWCVVLGLYAGAEAAALPSRLASHLEALLRALVVVSVTATAASPLAALVTRFAERRTLSVPVTGLAHSTVRFAVWVVGGLVLLQELGVAIMPILTALGVGGLAVALALQDTLSNLFAGVHILADRPIRIGDYIKLDNGIEGFVEDIGWRSTRIRLLSNNMAIVPNATIGKSAITNYFLPEPRTSVDIPVRVSYDADPDRIERILIEEATQAAAVVPGLLTNPPPGVSFIPGFGESALQCSLSCAIASYVDQYRAQHELRKRILRRFRAEQIEIPRPMRTVELRTTNGRGSTPVTR